MGGFVGLGETRVAVPWTAFAIAKENDKAKYVLDATKDMLKSAPKVEGKNYDKLFIHLGFRAGRNILFRFLDALRDAGVHHVILNLKYGKRAADEVLDEIGDEVLPQLAATEPETVAA